MAKAVRKGGCFLLCSCAEPCLPLAPQLFIKGEGFSLPLVFLAHLPVLAGSSKNSEQRPPRNSRFCGGRQVAAPVWGAARSCNPLLPPSPRRSWLSPCHRHGCRGSTAGEKPHLPRGQASLGCEEVHRSKGWKEGPAASRPSPAPVEGRRPCLRPSARPLRRPRAGPRAGPPRINWAAAAGTPAANRAVLPLHFFGSRVSRPSSSVPPAQGRWEVREAPRLPPLPPPPSAGRGGHVPPGLHLEHLLRRLRLPGGLPHRGSQLPAGTCPLPRRQRQEGLRRLSRGAHRHRPRQRRLSR